MISNFKTYFRQAYFLLLPFTLFLITACPEPPDTKPQLADCPVGKSPCEDDSTECCWDTTSHNFVWDIDTLGISGSLRDVQIIDENNIWVVGEIEVDDPDSSFNGTGRETFNAAHWNGREWEYIKIVSGSIELYSITYFNENDIWVCSGIPMHWNGIEWSYYHLWDMGVLNPDDGGVNYSWGYSSSDIYFVGRHGTIVHYDGTSFTKMASPTTQDLDGIVGIVDPETGAKRIWAYGWTDYPNRGLLLQSDGTDWEVIWDELNPYFEDEQYVTPTVWAGIEWFVSYSGGHDHSQVSIHKNDNLIDYEIIHKDYNGFIRDIGGQYSNDLFFVGYDANIFHYNGSTIKSFQSILNINPYNWFMGVDYKDGTIVAVTDMGLIIKGHH